MLPMHNTFQQLEKAFKTTIFLPENNDLLTPEEKEFNKIHVSKMTDFATGGKTTGIEIKNLTAGAAVIAKRQQSRSNTAGMKLLLLKQMGVVKEDLFTISEDPTKKD